MSTITKICPLCGKGNNPSLTHCYYCKHDLALPASEADVRAFWASRGLPKGVILFIIFALFGFVSHLPVLLQLKLSHWFEWVQLVGLNAVLLVIVIGLARSREWARKGVIVYLAVTFLMTAWSMINAQKTSSASYQLAFQQYQVRAQEEFTSGVRTTFTDQSLRTEFNSAMTSNLPIVLGTSALYSFLWIFYFAVPVKKYFHIKSELHKNKSTV